MGGGGGLYAEIGFLSFQRVTLSGKGGGNGTGALLRMDEGEIWDSAIVENNDLSNTGCQLISDQGAGLEADNGTLFVGRTTISGNQAGGHGGRILSEATHRSPCAM